MLALLLGFLYCLLLMSCCAIQISSIFMCSIWSRSTSGERINLRRTERRNSYGLVCVVRKTLRCADPQAPKNVRFMDVISRSNVVYSYSVCGKGAQSDTCIRLRRHIKMTLALTITRLYGETIYDVGATLRGNTAKLAARGVGIFELPHSLMLCIGLIEFIARWCTTRGTCLRTSAAIAWFDGNTRKWQFVNTLVVWNRYFGLEDIAR